MIILKRLICPKLTSENADGIYKLPSFTIKYILHTIITEPK